MLKDLAAADAAGDTVAAAHISKLLGGKPPMTSGEVAADVAASIPTGITDAITGFAGLPGEIGKLINSPAHGSPGRLPTGEDIRDFWSNLTGVKMHQPQTGAARFARSAVEGGTSFINPLNPTSKVGPAFGAAMGIGGQLGAEAMKEQPDYGRLLGQSPLLALAAYPALKSSQLARALAKYLSTIGGEGLETGAANAVKAAEVIGKPVLATQGLEDVTPLSGITRAVAAEPGGANIQSILNAQVPAGEAAARKFVENVSPRGFDQPDANAIVAAGKAGTYDLPRQSVQRATAPLYTAAAKDKMQLFGPEETPSIQSIVDDLLAAKDAKGLGLSKSGKAVDRAVKTLDIGEPPTVTALDTLAREARTSASNSYKVGADEKSVLARQGNEAVADVINAATKARSPALAGGKMVHQTGTEWVTNPTREGALGKMFPEGTANAETSTFGALTGSLEKMSAGDVRTVAEGLRRTDPGAFGNLVKKSFADKIDAVSKDVAGRRPDQMLSEIPSALRGSAASQQRAKFDAMIEEVAKDAKVDPVAARESANELMDAMRVIAREQGGKGAISQEFAESGSNMATRFFRSMSLTAPGRGLGWWLEKRNYRGVIEAVQDALTSPEGVKKLVELSEYSSKAHKVKTVARAIAGTAVQNQPRSPY
jgi:Arc/MetJ family transcription regulator